MTSEQRPDPLLPGPDGADRPLPPADAEAYRARLEAEGLSSYVDALLPQVRTGARLVPAPDGDGTAVGTTRLGGRPDLPTATAWPDGYDAPLSFVLQVDLAGLPAELADSGLPTSGLLSFFYDAVEQPWGFEPHDRGSWAVLHSAAGEELVARDFPDDLDPDVRYRPLALVAQTVASFPPLESQEAAAAGIGLDDEVVWERYERVLGAPRGATHRLLGHPDALQGDMQEESQLVSSGISTGGLVPGDDPARLAALPGADRWRLLAQVDSTPEATGMVWGDAGRLYFWIREDDLRAGAWDQVWVVLQCG